MTGTQGIAPDGTRTLLQRCPHPECYELMPMDAVDCGKHEGKNPHKCLDCDTIIYGKSLRCEAHKKAAVKSQWAAAKKREREEDQGPCTPHQAVAPPPRPSRHTFADMLRKEREQRRLNRQCDQRLLSKVADSLGLERQKGKPMASPVKVYSPEEIAAIAHTIETPKGKGRGEYRNRSIPPREVCTTY